LEEKVEQTKRSTECVKGGQSGSERHQPLISEAETDDNIMEVANQDEVDCPDFTVNGKDQKMPTQQCNLDKTVLLEKLNCIGDQQYGATYYKFKCTADISFWSRREHFRKQAFKTMAIAEAERENSPASSKETRKLKGRASKRRREKQSRNRRMIDPLLIEQQVMKLILECDEMTQVPDSTSTASTDNQTVFQCNCWVKFDSTHLDEWPEFFVILEKDLNGHTPNYVSGGTAITATLKKIFPEYMYFKLMQWFGVEEDGDSETENTKMKPNIPQAELTFAFSDSETEDKNGDKDEDNDTQKSPPVLSFPDSSADD